MSKYKIKVLGEEGVTNKQCKNCGKVTKQYYIGIGVTECKECGTTNYDFSEENPNKIIFGRPGAGKMIRELSPTMRQQIISYIDRVSSSGMGKKKSLEYIRKYVEKI